MTIKRTNDHQNTTQTRTPHTQGVNSGDPKRSAVPVLLVAPVVLFKSGDKS